MLIRDLSTSGAMPAAEMLMKFAGQRQRILAHNVANIDTPNFQMKDVDPRGFQSMLGDAIDQRREKTGGAFGHLEWNQTREIRKTGRSTDFRLEPSSSGGGILHHDRNNRDLERIMQDMVENATAYRVASDLLRSQRNQLQNAIAQRVI
ncbi:MAG: flagellar basal body rod protein FlgB [Phycisphaerales bacterium]